MRTHHKPPPELVGLPDLADDERVEHQDDKVGDDLDQDELGPEDVVEHVLGVAPEGRGTADGGVLVRIGLELNYRMALRAGN